MLEKHFSTPLIGLFMLLLLYSNNYSFRNLSLITIDLKEGG